jgi:FAD/FMN-containing dehydrogenase
MGRSYGISNLNSGQGVLDARPLDRFLAFDPVTAILRCEAGVTLDGILRLAVPRGFFLPVVPGTRFITVGGAIANDVHGKNHHREGTFGNHVQGFELRRSDGSVRYCSREHDPDWFGAAVGGLGLTGLVTWVELRLKRIPGPWIEAETIPFGDLAEGLALFAESDRDFEHTAAWIDAATRKTGRGLVLRGRWAADPPASQAGPPGRPPRPARPWSVPFEPPCSLVRAPLVHAFNALYFRRAGLPVCRGRRLVSWESFFFPLDGLRHWNRLYGPRGIVQYQCALPGDSSRETLAELLAAVRKSGQGSSLAVLKTFGAHPSPGWLSFPLPGVTLALDFAHRGDETLALLARLDRIVREGGGRLYPAKDGRIPAEFFRASYPAWETFREYLDPRVRSDFLRSIEP